MRRFTFALICTALLMSPCLTFAVNEIGPIQTGANQLEICMAKCNVNDDFWRAGEQPGCDFEIKWLNKNGNTLQSASFYDVPDQGSRELPYTLGTKLVSCRVDPINGEAKNANGHGYGEELSIAVLDNKGKTVAMMTNDRAEDMPMPRCNPCAGICIECATLPPPAPARARAAIPQICIDCQSCLETTQ